jgi:hypothetical protein
VLVQSTTGVSWTANLHTGRLRRLHLASDAFFVGAPDVCRLTGLLIGAWVAARPVGSLLRGCRSVYRAMTGLTPGRAVFRRLLVSSGLRNVSAYGGWPSTGWKD